MPTRKADATWKGGLKDGKGSMKLESGSFDGQYSFGTRFEEGKGSNPEELIAAAHAGCFSMAFSAGLEKAGFKPQRVSTNAAVKIENTGSGFGITRIDLTTEAEVPGIDEAQFQQLANEAKDGCPVSKALKSVGDIRLTAKLV
ncbi:MAG TPA: OsmC family protein [Thermoanaerobaculia bacterium]|nr:OsmC family protein [Thermoanaerobaculia bacterium]